MSNQQRPLFTDAQLEIDVEHETQVHNTSVVLVGSLTQEGVTTKIKSLGFEYVNKLLASNPSNWITISNEISSLRTQKKLVAVFVHLPEWCMFRVVDDPLYEQAWRRLLDELEKSRSLVFVYEDILAGTFNYALKSIADYRQSYALHQLPAFEIEAKRLEGSVERAKGFVINLKTSGAEIAPYKTRRDLTIRIQQFLDDAEGGVFLRLYVPNGRYQAEQLDGFLSLFESYLQSIEKLPFGIDVRRTKHGLTYVFKSKEQVATLDDLSDAVTRFESFMALCQNDPSQANDVLARMEMNSSTATALVAKYAKKYQRLQLDIKHEHEQKPLVLKQQLESESFELFVGSGVNALVDVSPSNLLTSPFNIGNTAAVATRSTMQSIHDTNAVVQKIINGDITYTSEDRIIIDLLKRHAEGLEAVSLKSELEQLKDESTPEDVRLTAKQKVAGFLNRIAPTVGESIVKGSLEYLQKLIVGS